MNDNTPKEQELTAASTQHIIENYRSESCEYFYGGKVHSFTRFFSVKAFGKQQTTGCFWFSWLVSWLAFFPPLILFWNRVLLCSLGEHQTDHLPALGSLILGWQAYITMFSTVCFRQLYELEKLYNTEELWGVIPAACLWYKIVQSYKQNVTWSKGLWWWRFKLVLGKMSMTPISQQE